MSESSVPRTYCNHFREDIVFIQNCSNLLVIGFIKTTVIVFHFVKTTINSPFKKFFVLTFPFLPLLLYISLPPCFPTSLPSSLPFTSLTISVNFQDYIPAFLQRGEKVHFCTVHRHNVLRKRANHRWWPRNVLSLLRPVNFPCRNSCYIVHFSSKVAKRGQCILTVTCINEQNLELKNGDMMKIFPTYLQYT